MPEGANVEIAHHLHERGEAESHEPKSRSQRLLEITEAILLAVVAIATAWSGYQSAQWDGDSAESYANASKYRVEADQFATRGGQERLYDATTFNAWLEAHAKGDDAVEDLFSRRFTPNFQVAFDAWLKTDPFNDPTAPLAPALMPEYSNPFEDKALRLDAQATAAFEAGAASRETGDRYVRVTVLLAMVLFVTAIAQRFDIRGVRISMLGVAGVFLVYCVGAILTYPHL